MTEATLIVVRFADPSKAYQALSALRRADGDGQVTVNQAAVMERNADGTMQEPDGVDNASGEGLLTGGLIGGLVGLIGGPLGLLFGSGTGAVIGGAYEADKADRVASGLAEVSRFVEPGSTALVADLVEVSPMIVDTIMTELGGAIIRRPTAEVEAELDAAEDAANAAVAEADRVLREERKAERKERFEERRDEAKERLGTRRDEAKERFDTRRDEVKEKVDSLGPDYPEEKA